MMNLSHPVVECTRLLQDDNLHLSAALNLHENGFAVIPVNAETKMPCIRGFAKFTRKPKETEIREWWSKWPNANPAILCKLSGVIVFDCDSAEAVHDFTENYGFGGVHVRTGRGAHFYFKATDQKPNRQGLHSDIDVKASVGEYVVGVGSVHKSGKLYELVSGSLAEREDFPFFPNLIAKTKPDQAFNEGDRNVSLFHNFGMPYASLASSPEDLIERLEEANQTSCRPPLPSSEVIKMASILWGYRVNGTLAIQGGEACLFGKKTDIDAMGGNANAWMLLNYLKISHSSRRQPFSITPKSMENSQVIPNWTRYKYETARKDLLELGFLKQVRAFDKKTKMSAKYLLDAPDPIGRKIYPNIIKHFSPNLSSSLASSKADLIQAAPVSPVGMPKTNIQIKPVVKPERHCVQRQNLPDDQLQLSMFGSLIDDTAFEKSQRDLRKAPDTLKDWRSNNNLTQLQAARKFSVTRSTLSNWENGQFLPSIASVALISEVTGVPLASR